MGYKVLAGRYDIHEKIGDGGMAVVYRARDKLLDRMVAIKILKPEFVKDVSFVDNFRKESRAAASLSHPNIVNIYDVGKDGNLYYIVMELVDGRSLSDVIAEEAPLDYKYAISVAEQIAAALCLAHKNNIIHRDVKPHNILITNDGVAKITDFGIAKAVTDRTIMKEDNAVIGSVHYFSPEQGRGQYVDEKSDIYSLGVVIYEMLTGRVPFDAEHPVAIAMMHMNDVAMPPSKLVGSVPPGLEQIVMKSMEKYAINRFRSADEMLKALRNVSFVTGAFTDDDVADIFRRTPEPEDGTAPDVSRALYDAGDDADYDEVDGDGASGDAADMETDEDSGETDVTVEEDIDAVEAEEKKRRKGFFGRGGKGAKGRDGKPVDPKVSKTKRWAVTAAIVAALALCYPAFLGISWFAKDKTVPVPALIGLAEEDALKKLEPWDLKLEITEEVFSDVYEPGIIVEQDPKQDTRLKRGDTVEVRVSKGAEELPPQDSNIPDLLGKSKASALYTIDQYGFTIGAIRYEDSDKAMDTVIAQTPDPGSKLEPGRAIDITISQGSKVKEASVPNLVGLTEASADAALRAQGLVPGNVTRDYSSAYPAGYVTWQQFGAGAKLNQGQAVQYSVSLGPKPPPPPDPTPPETTGGGVTPPATGGGVTPPATGGGVTPSP